MSHSMLHTSNTELCGFSGTAHDPCVGKFELHRRLQILQTAARSLH